MVRAFERAAGAFRAGDMFSAKAKLDENSRYTEMALSGLSRAENLSYESADQLEESQQERTLLSEALRAYGTLDRLLPDHVLAALYRARIDIDQLRRRTVHGTSGAVLAAALRASGSDLGELVSALREWDPAADARRLEGARRAGRFVIYGSDRRYGWRLIDRDDQLVADSQPTFATRDAARESIAKLVAFARDAEVVEE